MVAPKNNLKVKPIASSNDDGKMKASDEQAELAEAFESELAELKAKHDQYFLGMERFEPIKDRDDYKKRLTKFKTQHIRQTALRFRVNALWQKYLSYERMWERVAREIESGTYARDVFKAKMRGEKRAKKDEKKKKKEEKEPTTDPHIEVPESLRDPVPQPPAQPANQIRGGVPKPPPLPLDEDVPLVRPPTVSAPSKGPPPPPPQGTGARPPPPPPPSQPTVAAPRTSVTGMPAVKGPPPPPPSLTPAQQPLANRTSGSNPAARPPPPPPPGMERPVSGATRAIPPLPPAPPGSARVTGNMPAVRPPPPPGTPRPPPAAAAGVPGLGEDKVKALYTAYVAAKRQCREPVDGITQESVASTLRGQLPDLMKQHKSVDFKVVIKNGKAELKAVPKP
jgi:hypothetical protein